MRKCFLLIMIIVLMMLSIVVMGCEEKESSIEEMLVGEWQATDGSGSFIFNSDGGMMLTTGNIAVESIEDIQLNWRIDDTQEPIHLDFIGINKQTDIEEETPIRMIIRFLTDDKIQIRMGEYLNNGEWRRPDDFTDDLEDKSQFILTRQ
jgi:hypothetical protein